MGNTVQLDIELETAFTPEGIEIYPYVDDSDVSEAVMSIDWDSIYEVTVECAQDCESLATAADELEVMADRIRQYILDN